METKKIKILTSGVIECKGFIYGPVLTPYQETVDTIFTMVSRGIEVVEVLDDGTEVQLSTKNFDTLNSTEVTKPKQENVKPIVSTKPVVEESVIEEPVFNEPGDSDTIIKTDEPVQTKTHYPKNEYKRKK